jgi:hypothetical protein
MAMPDMAMEGREDGLDGRDGSRLRLAGAAAAHRSNRMTGGIEPTLLAHLAPLDDAVAEMRNTWRPDDPAYRADVYRQAMMNLSYSYFAYFHADAEHPDWAPLWNPVFTCQPNPDDIYLYSPIRADLRYRVSGHRGTVYKLIFCAQRGISGMVDEASECFDVTMIDEQDFEVNPDGTFEILFSAERPEGHAGNWCQLLPAANLIYVRYRMYDWEKEIDPQLSIECLDPVPPKPRLTPEQIGERLGEVAKFPLRMNRMFYDIQNQVKSAVGTNSFFAVRYAGIGSRQVYWPAVFDFDADEALIIETEMPEVAPYWNIQLNDPYFNAIEFVYRLSSTNGAMATLSSDGKLRAVVSLTDPGVPNWLDPAGYTEGTIYGRWYDCSSDPTPTLKRVKLAELRDHMPADTPMVTPEQRADELRRRVRACQRRRRW